MTFNAGKFRKTGWPMTFKFASISYSRFLIFASISPLPMTFTAGKFRKNRWPMNFKFASIYCSRFFISASISP